MANNPINMTKIRQILRLYGQGNSKMAITRLTGVSRNTLKKYIHDYERLGLDLHGLETLSDHELEELFSTFKPARDNMTPAAKHLMGLYPYVDKQLKRKGVTLHLLWEEYRAEHPDGLCVSQFGHYYSIWKQQVNPVMHIEHKAGDKVFVDYAGEKLELVDAQTGEVTPVEVFVAILGCSQLTYVEAVASQQKGDFIGCCERALHYIGGVPSALVTDNLKSAVTKSSKYEPVLNETFADFGEHYSITLLPTRAYRPRDKALVEGAVKIIYTRIYAKIRNNHYHDLAALNMAIGTALEEHNNTLLKGRGYSRRQQFEEVERPALQKLPLLRYEVKQQAQVTVMKNGHVCLGADKHYYSVPFRFIGRKVKLLFSTATVEVFYNYERIAFHQRFKSQYTYTTLPEHLASTHRFVTEWTPERFLQWAGDIDGHVREYIFRVLERKQHAEQAYKACMGILSMAKKYGNERLATACKRGAEYDMYSYRAICMILERGLDRENPQTDLFSPQMPEHGNIRGKSYYQ
jgi:transposase